MITLTPAFVIGLLDKQLAVFVDQCGMLWAIFSSVLDIAGGTTNRSIEKITGGDFLKRTITHAKTFRDEIVTYAFVNEYGIASIFLESNRPFFETFKEKATEFKRFCCLPDFKLISFSFPSERFRKNFILAAGVPIPPGAFHPEDSGHGETGDPALNIGHNTNSIA